MIFFLIAGTYTPFALIVMHGALATAILVVVWVGAIAGAIVEMVWIGHPKWVSALVYLSIGWVAVVAFPDLWDALGPGGKQSGCAVFIDRQLSGPYGTNDGLYMQGPFPANPLPTQGLQSPLTGSSVTIEGIVVGDYQATGQLGGFHVQEEDADADADPSTSEGIFVFNSSFPVSVGDKVRVNGTAVNPLGYL